MTDEPTVVTRLCKRFQERTGSLWSDRESGLGLRGHGSHHQRTQPASLETTGDMCVLMLWVDYYW